MSLGGKLLGLRKKAGLSQEEVADRLNVSRQTVSKWETDQTVPELVKAKQLSELYNISYDCLVSKSVVPSELTDMSALTDDIDWTSAWSKKYPILASYPQIEGIEVYFEKISIIYDEIISQFELSHLDVFLVLKDIVYQKYRKAKLKS